MVWPALIGAAATLGGGFMSAFGQSAANAQNMQLQQAANAQQQSQFDQNLAHARWQSDVQDQRLREGREFEAGQVQKQMDWQELMSSTAYQRATADMRKAGLNPILAYQQGGSSTPTGGAAGPGGLGSPTSGSGGGAGAAHVENTQAELGRAVGRVAQSAVDTYKTSETAKLVGQQYETEKNATTEMTNRAQLRGQEVSNAATQGHNLQQDWHIKERQKHLVEAQTDAAKAASASSYAGAAKALEETRQFRNQGMPGYGLGERILRGIETAPPVELPKPLF